MNGHMNWRRGYLVLLDGCAPVAMAVTLAAISLSGPGAPVSIDITAPHDTSTSPHAQRQDDDGRQRMDTTGRRIGYALRSGSGSVGNVFQSQDPALSLNVGALGEDDRLLDADLAEPDGTAGKSLAQPR